MRITGGSARGIPLKVPKGSATRPATDQMRQAVFSSLGETVLSARCLDLFAGTGAYGLEALSRGAHSCVFVEKDRQAVHCLRDNLAAVQKSLLSAGQAAVSSTVLAKDVATLADEVVSAATLIFADPPYAVIPQTVPLLLERIAQVALTTDVWFVVETPGNYQLQTSYWEIISRLGKGQHQPTVSVLKLLCTKENQP